MGWVAKKIKFTSVGLAVFSVTRQTSNSDLAAYNCSCTLPQHRRKMVRKMEQVLKGAVQEEQGAYAIS